MREPREALEWLADEAAHPSQDWYNLCEQLCRKAYGLDAHYSSAELHATAIPGAHRFGIDPPYAGDLILYRNGGYGHIVVATGDGWNVYTNDYGGRGTVCVADARDLVAWCGASSGYVANAYWSATNVKHTHTPEDEMPLTDDDVERVRDAVISALIPPTGYARDVHDAEGWDEPTPKELGALVYNTATRLRRMDPQGG